MTNFFQVECSVNDNNSTVEIIQYDANDLIIQEGVAILPADFVNIVDGEIINFLDAGYGIDLTPSTTGLLISTTGLQPSGNYALLSGANFTGNISAPIINADQVYMNGILVSVSGHTHIIPDVNNLQNILDDKINFDDIIEGGFF